MGARAGRIREPASGSARRTLPDPREIREQLEPGGLLGFRVSIRVGAPDGFEVSPPRGLAGDREVSERGVLVAWHRIGSSSCIRRATENGSRQRALPTIAAGAVSSAGRAGDF